MNAGFGWCPFCGGRVSPGARFCGVCGNAQPAPAAPRRSRRGIAIVAVLAAVALAATAVGAVFMLRPNPANPGTAGLGASPVATTTAGLPTGTAPAASGGPAALATAPVVDGASDPTALVPPDLSEGAVPAPEQTTPATGRLTLGPATSVAAQTVGTAGGKIAGAGVTLEFPAGALVKDTQVSISQAPVTQADFGGLFTPLTPLYTVDDGGSGLAAPVTVTLSATVPPDATALVFSYDEAAGTLTPLAPIAADATSITAAASHFSGIIGGKFSAATAPGTADSGFRPGIDDWQFTNNGSYVAPDGHCEGQSDTAIWYYLFQRRKGGASPLWGLYDNNGASDKTPTFQWDDSEGYRLASNVQVDPTADRIRYWASVKRLFGRADDRMTYEAFRAAIDFTGEPQEITISSGGDPEHAMIVYRVTADRLFIEDPNFPGKLRTIHYDAATGMLSPYSSGANAAEIAANGATIFTRFAYVPWRSAASEAQLAARWAEFEHNTAGNTVFPTYSLEALAGKDPAGKDVWVPLVDGFATTEKKLTVRLGRLSDGASSTMVIYPGTSSTALRPKAWKQTLDLADGANPFGFGIWGRKNGSWEYVDFVRLTIRSGESTDWTLDDVQVKHTGISVNQDYDWSYTGDGRGGIAGIWKTGGGTPGTVTMSATWQIPDSLTPGAQVEVSGNLGSTTDFDSQAASFCSELMHQLGPEDGWLMVSAMTDAATTDANDPAATAGTSVPRKISLINIGVGCNTTTNKMEPSKSQKATFDVPARPVVAAGQQATLLVTFLMSQDLDEVTVTYTYH